MTDSDTAADEAVENSLLHCLDLPELPGCSARVTFSSEAARQIVDLCRAVLDKDRSTVQRAACCLPVLITADLADSPDGCRIFLSTRDAGDSRLLAEFKTQAF